LGNNTNITVPDLAGQSTVYATPGTYTAYVVAVNGNCNDTAFVTIIVDEYIAPVILPVAIEFPNVFTPNNDLVNDVFGPTNALNIKSLEMTIVNRWGNVIYNESNLLPGWDGTSNGKECSEGVYFWKVEYEDFNSIKFSKHGFLHLEK
jgi:gliding motility-associated-like protein